MISTDAMYKLARLGYTSAIASAVFWTVMQTSAASIELLPVKGSPGAQAMQQAYNALVNALKKLPTGKFPTYTKSVDAAGNVTLQGFSVPRDQGHVDEVTSHDSKSTIHVSANGNIDCETADTETWLTGQPQTKPSSLAFTRGADGSLTYTAKGMSRFGTISELKLVLHGDGTTQSSLDSASTRMCLADIRPAQFVPGGDQAWLCLANYVEANDHPQRFMPIRAQDKKNAQGIKSAYNCLLSALQKAPIGHSVKTPIEIGGQPATIVDALIDSAGNKVVKTKEDHKVYTVQTVQVLKPNGTISVHCDSNSERLGSNSMLYEPLPQGGLKVTHDQSPPGSRHFTIVVHGDGSTTCDPVRAWCLPQMLGIEAPGGWEEKINWDRACVLPGSDD